MTQNTKHKEVILGQHTILNNTQVSKNMLFLIIHNLERIFITYFTLQLDLNNEKKEKSINHRTFL